MKLGSVALAALFAGLALPAQATGLRCNPDLVEAGDSAAQLLQSCGEPLVRQPIVDPQASPADGQVEQWTYSFGPGTLLHMSIANGRIVVVEDRDPPAEQSE